jgi:hypothetical protein
MYTPRNVRSRRGDNDNRVPFYMYLIAVPSLYSVIYLCLLLCYVRLGMQVTR